jgi:hemolysin activation/secretion protein
MKKILTLSTLAATLTLAATIPNAGSILKEVQPIQSPIQEKSLPVLNQQQYAPNIQADNGTKVLVKQFVIEKNTVVSTATLHSLIKGYENKELTLKEIKEVADIITKYYRSHNYFVARAYIPAQELSNNIVKIDIIEGKYGQVSVTNNSLVRSNIVQGYMDHLKDETISSASLDREMLLINDLSGAKIVAAQIMPGKSIGTSDFALNVEPTQRFQGYLLSDNYGSIYTGEYRATAGVSVNSALGFGDILSLSALSSTSGGLRNAQASYVIPLGYSGLKADASASATKYILQGDYAALDAHGEADVFGGGVSYPLIRSEAHSLYLRGGYATTILSDYNSGDLSKKHVNAFEFSLKDNYNSALFGKPLQFNGSLAYTRGDVILDNATAVTNDATLNSAGYFSKAVVNTNTTLFVSENTSLKAVVNGQTSFSKNLDSSQKITIGGASGVRAYTESELSGDKAVLGSLEADYRLPSIAGFNHQAGVFYDTAYVWENADAWSGLTSNSRQLDAFGISYGASYKFLNLIASFAHGFGPNADPVAGNKNNDNKLLMHLSAVF